MLPLEGLEFVDAATGRKCLVQTWGPDGLWLFWKHPDGQYVGWRKLTDDDRDRILKAMKADADLYLVS
jgi:hypothetical protein